MKILKILAVSPPFGSHSLVPDVDPTVVSDTFHGLEWTTPQARLEWTTSAEILT